MGSHLQHTAGAAAHCATDGKGTLPLTTLEDVEVGFCGGHWPAKIISASPSAGQTTVRVEASGETLVVSSDVITPLQRQTTGEAMDGRPLLEAPADDDDDDDDGDDRLVVADAHPPMCDTTASGLRPAWAGLGCEVECCEVSGAFAGAYASGELLEWMDEPTTAEAAAEAGLEYQCLGTYRQRGRQPRSRHEVRERGPWARVQTRLSVDRSPYAPEGRLVVERSVPIARLQPRPPPPPADFLAAPRVGLPVQVWHEGMWWRASLTAVEPAAAARGGGAAIFQVASSEPEYADVGGLVDASRLRPDWQWSGGAWSVAKGEAAGATAAAAAAAGGGGGGGGEGRR